MAVSLISGCPSSNVIKILKLAVTHLAMSVRKFSHGTWFCLLTIACKGCHAQNSISRLLALLLFIHKSHSSRVVGHHSLAGHGSAHDQREMLLKWPRDLGLKLRGSGSSSWPPKSNMSRQVPGSVQVLVPTATGCGQLSICPSTCPRHSSRVIHWSGSPVIPPRRIWKSGSYCRLALIWGPCKFLMFFTGGTWR